MPARKGTSKKRSTTLTKRDALAAAKKARGRYAGKKLPASWKKGGRDYSRILGHFGSKSVA